MSESRPQDDRDWREVRQTIGLTRRKLAAKLGTSKNTVRSWETGEKSPSIAYQEQILDLLEDAAPDGCGCLGCHDDAVAVIDHPTKGERTVCESHINGYRVKRRVAHV